CADTTRTTMNYKANTKAGRTWIDKILASAERVHKVEIDLVTDKRSAISNVPIGLVRRLIEIDGRKAVLYGLGSCTYVYLATAEGRTSVRFEIRTYAFDPNDLPDIAG
ncbi:MAG: hypothetical protein ACTHU0_23485, partial [Kofleriaceae bacterium]